MGLTQVTVREALSRLVADGLAVQEPYRGVRALSVSQHEVEGVLQMRAMLEGWSMEDADELEKAIRWECHGTDTKSG